MDPKFVNAAGGDFHLMAGSPAIDAADPAVTQTLDFDGVARPQGAGRDMGAFEHERSVRPVPRGSVRPYLGFAARGTARSGVAAGRRRRPPVEIDPWNLSRLRPA
jgi:hypothetical protein